jgi:hypothetical protein
MDSLGSEVATIGGLLRMRWWTYGVYKRIKLFWHLMSFIFPRTVIYKMWYCYIAVVIVSPVGCVVMELVCFPVWIQIIKPVSGGGSFSWASPITLSAIRRGPSDWSHSFNPRMFVVRWGCVCLHTLLTFWLPVVWSTSHFSSPCHAARHPKDDRRNVSCVGITEQHASLRLSLNMLLMQLNK